MSRRPRILVAEDETIVRLDSRSLLQANDMELCGEARDGVEAVELAASLEPDVILLDVKMPRLDGIEANPLSGTRAERLGGTRIHGRLHVLFELGRHLLGRDHELAGAVELEGLRRDRGAEAGQDAAVAIHVNPHRLTALGNGPSYIRSIIARPNPEDVTSVAPSSRRAKS